MTTQIDRRYPEAGFVMVDVGGKRVRRMVYAPQRGYTGPDPRPLSLAEANWGPLTPRQRAECRRALAAEFPGRRIIEE